MELPVEKSASEQMVLPSTPTHSHGTENVRTRVAVMDEDGNTTYIGELSDLNGNAAEEVFGIDGMRLPEMRKGINIVRQKDGSVRKIVK